MKYASVLLLFFFVWTHVNAQVDDERRFTAAVVAGMNLSQIDGDGYSGYHKIGMNLGARGGVILAKRWEMAFEILFSQQGSQDNPPRGFIRNYRAHFNVIEVPVMVLFNEWEVEDGNGDRFHRIRVGLGASYNRILSGREEISGIRQFEGDVSQGGIRENYVQLFADVNVFFTKNWGMNIRYSRAPMNLRANSLYNPYMITVRAVFAF